MLYQQPSEGMQGGETTAQSEALKPRWQLELPIYLDLGNQPGQLFQSSSVN
jgi:hypothetical protein